MMVARAGSRRPGRLEVALLGLLLIALITAGCAIAVRYPVVCVGFAISVAQGAVGEPTPEAAFQRWRAEYRVPTPHFGWTAVPRDGAIDMINGRWRVEILELARARGSGWLVTQATC